MQYLTVQQNVMTHNAVIYCKKNIMTHTMQYLTVQKKKRNDTQSAVPYSIAKPYGTQCAVHYCTAKLMTHTVQYLTVQQNVMAQTVQYLTL